jgi:hypothetical protein
MLLNVNNYHRYWFFSVRENLAALEQLFLGLISAKVQLPNSSTFGLD